MAGENRWSIETDRQLKPAVPGGAGAGETAIFRRVEISAQWQWRFAVSVGGFWVLVVFGSTQQQNISEKNPGVSRLVRV